MGPRFAEVLVENAKVKIEEGTDPLQVDTPKQARNDTSRSFPHFAFCILTFAF